MARLSALASFLLILAAVFGGLRVVHTVVPLIYAPADPRPFHTGDPDAAARQAGFAPWIPFYLPESLGSPPRLTVFRRPVPRIALEWSGTSRLLLREQPATARNAVPRAARPLTGGRGDVWWQGPDLLHAVAWRAGLRIEISTDLSVLDLERLAATLQPAGVTPPME